MATQFGYRTPSFGYYPQAPAVPAGTRYPASLTSALSGGTPLTANTSGYGGAQGYQALNPIHAAPAPRPPALPQQTAANVNPRGVAQNTAPTPGVYDLNTDPILQQITALSGMGDQQANAAALKQRQQLLLGYGDPNLAGAVLGQEDPTVQAAAQNPASLLAQLATQHGRNQAQLEDALNKANLFYGGYRVNQEGQALQDYQTQIANQSGAAQGGLDQIAGNLTAALAQNQQQRLQAQQDAYMRAIQEALANPPVAAAQPQGGAYPPGTALPQVGSGNVFTGGAPAGTVTTDPEHNAYLMGASDVDPFAVQSGPSSLQSALATPSPVAPIDPTTLIRLLLGTRGQMV